MPEHAVGAKKALFAAIFISVLIAAAILSTALKGVSGNDESKNILFIAIAGASLIGSAAFLFFTPNLSRRIVFIAGIAACVLISLSAIAFFRGATLHALAGFAFEPGTLIWSFACVAIMLAAYIVASRARAVSIAIWTILVSISAAALIGYVVQFFPSIPGVSDTSVDIRYLCGLGILIDAFLLVRSHLFRDRILLLVCLALCAAGALVPVAKTSSQIQLSWQSTEHLALTAYAAEPGSLLFGTGPVSFSHVWNQYRPKEVNATPFWNQDFEQGFSFLSTLTLEFGVLPLLLLIIMPLSFGSAVWLRRLRSIPAEALLWLGLIWYGFVVIAFSRPGSSFMLIALFLMGMCISRTFSSSEALAGISRKEVKWVLIALFLATGVALCSFAAMRAHALSEYNGGVAALQAETAQPASAEEHFTASLKKSTTLEAARALASVQFLQSQLLVKSVSGTMTSSQASTTLHLLISAESAAETALSMDPMDLRTMIVLANVRLFRFSVTGDSEELKKCQEVSNEAARLYPAHPAALFLAAQAAAASQDYYDARSMLDSALALKPDFTEAQKLRASLPAR